MYQAKGGVAGPTKYLYSCFYYIFLKNKYFDTILSIFSGVLIIMINNIHSCGVVGFLVPQFEQLQKCMSPICY